MDTDLFRVMLSLGLSGAATYAAVALVSILITRLKGGSPPGVSAEELTYLRDRAEEVDQLAERVAELETRLDFAERLLTGPAEERHDTPAGSG